MLQFYTKESLFPNSYQIIGHPNPWFSAISETAPEVLLTKPVSEALWEIERSTVDNLTGLPKNSLGNYFSWDDLGSGLKNLVIQYYLCNGGEEGLIGDIAIQANFCGSNIMSFMFLHSKWFDKVPIYLDCFNFAINPATEPLNGQDCGYCYNAEYREFFEKVHCKINGYELSYQEAVDLMLCMKGGYYKSWAYQILKNPDLSKLNVFLDEESKTLVCEKDTSLGENNVSSKERGDNVEGETSYFQ